MNATSVKAGQKVGFTVNSAIAPEKDLTINVESDNTSIATVPATITMKAGEKSVSGEVSGIAKGDANISISADGVKVSGKTAKITVTESTPPAPEVVKLSIATSASQVTAGEKIKFTVSSPVAPESDITVSVTSSNTAAATVPASVTLAAGQKSVEGDITGVAEGTATVTIAAEGVEIATASKEITVLKAPVLELSIASATNKVTIGKTLQFTISTPLAPTSDITLTLSSSNPDFVSLGSETLTLAAGQKSVTGTLNGVAEGTSTISFTASPETEIAVESIDITSEILRPEIALIGLNGPCNESNYWISFAFGNSNYCGGMFYQNRGWGNSGADNIYKNAIENYGCDFVGTMHNGYGVFTSVDEGTPIDENLAWVTNPGGGFPAVWKSDGFTLGDGEHYIVTQFKESSAGVNKYNAWLKVQVNGSAFTILSGAVCLNDAPFSVGQE